MKPLQGITMLWGEAWTDGVLISKAKTLPLPFLPIPCRFLPRRSINALRYMGWKSCFVLFGRHGTYALSQASVWGAANSKLYLQDPPFPSLTLVN